MEPIPGTEQLRVRTMTWEAEDVLSVVLSRDDRADLPAADPGAHLELILRPDLIRQYSLCGDRDIRDEWRIAVLRQPDGRGGSTYVHDVLRPGMRVLVRGPRNAFPLVKADRYLFIAGGIGITPLLPMIREVARAGVEWSLLYGGRHRRSMAFVDDLREFRTRVALMPQDESGPLDLGAALAPLDRGVAVYCCGPEGLIAAVEAQCALLEREPPHVERFTGRAVAEPLSNAAGQAFQIVLTRAGRTLTVPPDRSIVEVLAEAGVYVPTSCTEGYCGACETRVVGGVPDHRDDYFTDEERARNDRMMVCVGRSTSKELILEL